MHISNSAHSNMNNNIIYFQVICLRVLTRRVFLRRFGWFSLTLMQETRKSLLLLRSAYIIGTIWTAAYTEKTELETFSYRDCSEPIARRILE